MDSAFGLSGQDLEAIVAILQKHHQIQEAIIFGSRAKGNYKNGSDVDIALRGEKVDFNVISHVSYLLNEETLMPFKFDVLNYSTINSVELLEHINRVGLSFYKK